MSRTLTGAVSSALEAAAVPVIVFVEMDFSSGATRFCSAPMNILWNGETWYGVGALGKISAVSETGNVEAKGLSLELTGINPALISLALGEHYQGRSCSIYAAPLDSDHQVLADPKEIFSGRMDTMEITLGDVATIRVTVESRLADLERPRVRRYNDADQRAVYPDDAFFQYVDQMVEVQLEWGRGSITQAPA